MKQEGKLEDKEFPKTCELVNYYKFSEEGDKFMNEDISKRIYDEGFEDGQRMEGWTMTMVMKEKEWW